MTLASWTANAVLGDGETVSIRPITPDDAPRLAAFHERQSDESRYRRYFTPKPTLSKRELEHFTNVDLVDRAALVVESHGELLGWASYERWPGRDDADTAFMVDDRRHGTGIATLLLEHLAAIAVANGIVRFTAEVLGENRPMLAVFAHAGWPLQRRFESGVMEVDFPIAPSPEFVDSMSRREQRAGSRAMARMLLPRAIAVIGATDRPGSVGAAVWRNVTNAATVPVYAVSRSHPDLGDATVFASVTDIPATISLAVIVVPAASLDQVIDDCIAAHVRGAVVVTSVDDTGVDLDAIVLRARNNGMRIIGPSSMGVTASRREVGLNASLVPQQVIEGGVAIAMQSGSLGASFLELAKQQRLGLSWFVSLGDRADVAATDLLQFFEDDDSTNVIGMYTEDLGDPRRFARIARRVSQHRPIVAVRTSADLGPTNSALYRYCGLIEVPTVAALLDTVRVLATQPVLRGDRVAVLSNYPSPQRLASRAIAARGLRPVDAPQQLDFRSTPADYVEAIDAALRCDEIDGLMVVYAPPLAEAVAPVTEIDAVADAAGKPVTTVLLATADGPITPGSKVPNFMFPEPAAAVLSRSWAYGRWLATEAASPPTVVSDVDSEGAGELIAGALLDGSDHLDPATTADLLATYGITVPPTRYVAIGEALEAAIEVGFPVAVKARHRNVGRSVRAGVALDLVDAPAIAAAIDVMRAELGDHADYVIVQAMTPPGLDLRIRATLDDEAGPLMSVGIGGFQAGLLDDPEAVRLAPLSAPSAMSLVTESRAGPALNQSVIDPAALVDLLTRTAQLAADHAEITALDLNPVIVGRHGCAVTDAVVRLAPVGRPPGALRRL
ncbi:MAG TPA: GNAT family N-acetyltransferase [Desertimonas sp.]|nr:GNAT family N-acetyltransferase [Desertimonas sp.]